MASWVGYHHWGSLVDGTFSILLHQPLIILPAIYDIVHVDCLSFDLIQNEIPFCYQHSVVLVGWNKLCLQVRITLWHLAEGAYGIHQLVFQLKGDRRVFLGQKTKMVSQHLMEAIGNNNPIVRSLFHVPPRQ